MIRITATLAIDERALTWSFVRSPGPGGQNVNKVATSVLLRFDARGLPGDVLDRLRPLAGRRFAGDGSLVIQARRFRSQERNREDALARLVTLLRHAAEPPRPRRETRVPRGEKRRRLDSKRRRAAAKRARGAPGDLD